MTLDPEVCYKAVSARDRRFDGWFFVGVSSTGIYCRPVCNVRTPRFENCSFYGSAAAAEKAGFRPCLKCRPELAPGGARFDATRELADAAAAMIDEGFLNRAGLPALAARIGITERHLRRIFADEFGVSPIEYAQTQRLLLAKRLLTDTALPVTEIALASGFGSVRRFNGLFKTRYGFAPGRLRLNARHAALPDSDLVFQLAYRPPFAWHALLDFLGDRAIEGVELLEGDIYTRTLNIERQDGQTVAGWCRVTPRPDRHVLQVTLPPVLAGSVPQVLGKLRHLFDLGARPDVIDAHLGPLATTTPGLRVPGGVDGFEIAVRAIVGQQITVKGARRLLGRLAQRFGTPLSAPAHGLTHTFPSAAQLLAVPPESLGEAGIIRSRSAAIHGVAQAIVDGHLRLDPLAPLETTVKALLAIKGIGPWTAQYIAMRALGSPDAIPVDDLVLRQALGVRDGRAVTARTAQWAPWRAYAALHIWRAAAQGPAGQPVETLQEVLA
ncbi:DNA-3-methyladenine glycosylase 2 family protein [Pandoraea apista]|uniref:DNA-3-methyladenine glycosylase II n=1 Tax=Pandoraea apista TaxID=93218 RepID=A0A0B5FI93_9BURK|nr:DNA-3-methyladenine glycosylase 2 family protein [Pandoraea apista]AJE99458.1 adenosine deaminase [Pandoraea apista]AKH73574.1 adenosine deaminase [Pandoraea apista]AKI62122.1 adenosine deaminase [Pandoraea apista]ALS63878.1 adenosine deaminase [Pandoraea apista]AVF40414.1 DNA-3-methyladenine glycosylase 2 family protein [Pandoraea apista]